VAQTGTMSRRELIKRLIAGENVERCGLWLGKPNAHTWPILHGYFNTRTEEEWRQKLNDDCRWIGPQSYKEEIYKHPSGLPMFDSGLDREKFGSVGPLAHCETIEQIEEYPWPDPDFLDFEPCLRDLRQAGDVYRFSGFWTCFFHNLCDLFGMEEYLVKMHTDPDLVHAATEKVCGFYHEANERFFAAAGDMVDAFFFGNDFCTQRSLICGPEQFHQFIYPWSAKFAQQGHDHGLQVVLHSCGSIHPVIGSLIDAGVNCLHPLQALASNMDAATLARDFKGRIAFMGGIDMQELLTHGTPEQVTTEVHRVKNLLGPNLIVSPSHEAILPNVPPQNLEALAQAANPAVT
jgi:uroporphyrinogen decarboxylase